MQNENWKTIKEVLLETLSLDAAERRDFLDKANLSVEVRKEVESLLAFEEESEDLMRLSAVEFSKDFFNDNAKNTLIGQRVGAYQIVGELGQGGMGAVYLAERSDGAFSQRVALKLIKRGMDSDAILRRFINERQILASLKHPNIAHLIDGGTTADDVPYFVMEHVEGETIADYVGRENLAIASGEFSALHFRFVDIPGLPLEHPPYDLWCTDDGDYVLLKAQVGGYMQTAYELTTITRTDCQ